LGYGTVFEITPKGQLRQIGSGSSTETASTEIRMAVLAVAGAVKTLSEERNLIVHGTWGELDGVPTVESLRPETIDSNVVTFESFPPDRLRDFIRELTTYRDQAMAMTAQVESSGRGLASKGARTPKGSSEAPAGRDRRPIAARRRVWGRAKKEAMPHGGALVLSDLRQPTLSIVCEPCGRRGR
jgi:hypothetical protein